MSNEVVHYPINCCKHFVTLHVLFLKRRHHSPFLMRKAKKACRGAWSAKLPELLKINKAFQQNPHNDYVEKTSIYVTTNAVTDTHTHSQNDNCYSRS